MGKIVVDRGTGHALIVDGRVTVGIANTERIPTR